MHDAEAFSRNILDNMSDGVLAVDREGMVRMFNPAGADILGIPHEGVEGRTFAEVFLEVEGNDVFVETVLDAVYQSAAETRTTLKFLRPDQTEVYLRIISSYLRFRDEEPQGVILVFSDITELTLLKEEQEELNRQLTKAYLDLESSHSSLSARMHLGRKMRWVALLAVLVLFLGVGGYFWKTSSGGFGSGSGGGLSPMPMGMQSIGGGAALGSGGFQPGPNSSRVPVRTQAITNSVSLSGPLGPLAQINITAPFSDNLTAVHVEIGQTVRKGDPLVELGSGDILGKLRTAKSDYIKAQMEYKELAAWRASAEVAKAQRDRDAANRKVQQSARVLEESRMLFEKSIIPRTELESAEESWRSAVSTLTSAQENLDTVLERGNTANREVARMKMQNAQDVLDGLQDKYDRRLVLAPVDGVVLAPPSSDKDKDTTLAVGSQVSEGQVLFALGDLGGMSIKARVDEVDVLNLHEGQKVRVTGDAFPDTHLQGEVVSISAQATRDSRGMRGFDVRVVIPHLTDAERRVARLGMTSTLEVVVYENPEARLVPVQAVFRHGDGYAVYVDKGGTPVLTPVEPGITTVTSVEIVKGVEPGQRVLLPPSRTGGGGGSSGGGSGSSGGGVGRS